MKRLTDEVRRNVVDRAKEGLSSRAIAQLYNIHRSTVSRIIKNTDDVIPPQRPGRPRQVSVRDERRILRSITSGVTPTVAQAVQHFKSEGSYQLSVSSIKRILRRNGLHGRVRRKKPLLKRKHRQRRYAFALRYRKWKITQWKSVIWSDESKFNVFGSDGRQYCWKRAGEPLRDHHVQPTVKHGGGSIMVWGCMTWEGVGNLCRIDGGLDGSLYQTILEEDLLGTLEWYGLSKGDVIFQHDNDPKHTAKSTQEWIEDNDIRMLGWPAQSPDLNPIEHLWNEVDRRIRNRPVRATSKESLWEILQEVWNGIEPEFCQKLITSMPDRLSDVRKAKGGYTFW